MPSIQTLLAEALTEIKNLSKALGEEVEERRRDHDELIKLREWYKTLFNKDKEREAKIKELETERENDKNDLDEQLKELDDHNAKRVEGLVKESVEQEFVRRDLARAEEQANAKKDNAKEWKRRVWDIVVEVVKWAIAAGLGAFLGKKFGA